MQGIAIDRRVRGLTSLIARIPLRARIASTFPLSAGEISLKIIFCVGERIILRFNSSTTCFKADFTLTPLS